MHLELMVNPIISFFSTVHAILLSQTILNILGTYDAQIEHNLSDDEVSAESMILA